MELAYLVNSFLTSSGGVCNGAICGLGAGCGAGWVCANPADDWGGGAIWDALDPGAPAGGARIFRSSFTSSSGCRVVATRSLSEMMFEFLCGAFCKSDGSSRNVTSLPVVRFFAATAECQGRYF